jgi:hypothetical protein
MKSPTVRDFQSGLAAVARFARERGEPIARPEAIARLRELFRQVKEILDDQRRTGSTFGRDAVSVRFDRVTLERDKLIGEILTEFKRNAGFLFHKEKSPNINVLMRWLAGQSEYSLPTKEVAELFKIIESA